MEIHGLRSAYETIGSVVYFGRMLDKIRLHAVGALPFEYQALLGMLTPVVLIATAVDSSASITLLWPPELFRD